MLTTNFSLEEFRCHDEHHSPVPEPFLENVQLLATNLQVLRDYIGVPIHINSGYRTPAYNASVGGKKGSYHLKAMAADIRTDKHSPEQLAAIIETLIKERKMKQGGIGIYKTFVHYDVRGRRNRWNG